MDTKTQSTKQLSGTRVVGGKRGTSRIGKVGSFVFHPTEKRVVGFLVKRPDLLWMFHRKDLFVSLDSFDFEDGRIRLPYKESKAATGLAACKRLGLTWDECTLWEGMPLMTASGETFGAVDDVAFLRVSGKIVSVGARKGSLDTALLGHLEIPASLIRGFKVGAGVPLAGGALDNQQEVSDEQDDERAFGAILVHDAVVDLAVEGGLAEKAGKGAAVAQDRIQKATKAAKPHVEKAARATEDAAVKGAYATGRQISRAKGMFGAFKDEYRKARFDESNSKE